MLTIAAAASVLERRDPRLMRFAVQVVVDSSSFRKTKIQKLGALQNMLSLFTRPGIHLGSAFVLLD